MFLQVLSHERIKATRTFSCSSPLKTPHHFPYSKCLRPVLRRLLLPINAGTTLYLRRILGVTEATLRMLSVVLNRRLKPACCRFELRTWGATLAHLA